MDGTPNLKKLALVRTTPRRDEVERLLGRSKEKGRGCLLLDVENDDEKRREETPREAEAEAEAEAAEAVTEGAATEAMLNTIKPACRTVRGVEVCRSKKRFVAPPRRRLALGARRSFPEWAQNVHA